MLLTRLGRIRRTVTLAVVGALTLAACGGSPLTSGGQPAGQDGGQSEAEKVFAKFNAMSGEERHDALVAAAKEEGELTLYGAPESSAELVAAFEELYGIKVDVLTGQTEERTQKFIQEEQAGRHVADVITNAMESIQQFDQMGFLGPYKSDLLDEVPEELRGENWTAFVRVAFVAGYNTTLVDPAEIPEDFAEFADPKWKGRISLELGDFAWFMALYGHYKKQGMTDDQVTDLFNRIASNAKVVSGHSQQASLLSAGQFGVAVSAFTQSIDREIEKGAPVAWLGDGTPTTQPIVVRYTSVGASRHAPHPAAAQLYLDFLLSPDAYPAYAAQKQLPIIPPPDDPLAGLETLPIDPDQLATEQAKWSDLYDVILRNASQ